MPGRFGDARFSGLSTTEKGDLLRAQRWSGRPPVLAAPLVARGAHRNFLRDSQCLVVRVTLGVRQGHLRLLWPYAASAVRVQELPPCGAPDIAVPVDAIPPGRKDRSCAGSLQRLARASSPGQEIETFLEVHMRSSQVSEPAMDLSVTVVVPCRNERNFIEGCMRTLLEQRELPAAYEVLAVDGMSDDGTREILARLAGADRRLRVLDNPQRIVSTAL